MSAPLFMPIRLHIYYDGVVWDDSYSSSGRLFSDRQMAIDFGIELYRSDDFRIATLIDGRLAAVGCGYEDFSPVAAFLAEVARHLELEVAA